MAYATPQDFIDRFGPHEAQQLSDIGASRTGHPAETVLLTYLGDASAEIDAYLVGRVAMPMASTPAILRVYCCDIARYRMQFTAPDERAKGAYDAAISYLRRVATGDISLTAPSETPVQGLGEVMFWSGDKLFGRDDCTCSDGSSGSGPSFWRG